VKCKCETGEQLDRRFDLECGFWEGSGCESLLAKSRIQCRPSGAWRCCDLQRGPDAHLPLQCDLANAMWMDAQPTMMQPVCSAPEYHSTKLHVDTLVSRGPAPSSGVRLSIRRPPATLEGSVAIVVTHSPHPCRCLQRWLTVLAGLLRADSQGPSLQLDTARRQPTIAMPSCRSLLPHLQQLKATCASRCCLPGPSRRPRARPIMRQFLGGASAASRLHRLAEQYV
jgi:hypothetical protein